MDPATLIGIVLALVGVFTAMILEGGSPMAIFLLPPLILVFAGTFGAAIAGSAMSDLKKIVGWFKQAVMPAKVPPIADRIQTLVTLAEKARKEGLLALEAQVKDIEDPFLKRGLQMGIDGTDPEELRATLEAEIAAKKAAGYFTKRSPRTGSGKAQRESKYCRSWRKSPPAQKGGRSRDSAISGRRSGRI